ncbi:MAG TPA: PAS domain S-box protein, partial [Candidatus Caenarcaniphilales bacterium]
QTAQQLLGQGIAPEATAEQLAQVYQVYTAGTDRLYPNTQLPLVQALRGESATVDDMEIHQGDRIIALETWATPIFNEKGEIIYAISAFQDITARKQAEVALQEREKQYREIFEATSDGLIINTLEGKIAEANPAACKMHGYAHQEFVDLDPKTFTHPDYHHLLSEYVRSSQHQIQFEAQAIDLRKDGTAFPVEIRGTTFTYKGKPHSLAVVRDITERKQAEAQLRLSAQRDRLLGEIALRIRQSLDLEQILNTTVTEVRQFLGCDRVGICYIDKNWQTKGLAESVAPGWRSLLGITLGDPTFSRNMLAYYQQGVQAVDDISQVEFHSANSANIEILQQYQIRAYLGAPIMLDASHTEAYPVLPGLEHSEKYFDDQ